MGLILTTRGWTGASIEWEHASGTDTYTPPIGALLGDDLNPLDVAYNLKDWLEDWARRPWSSTEIATVSLAVEDDGKRHRFVYSFTGTDPTFISITPNAAWIACFGDTSASPPGTARGTLAKELASVNWLKHDNERGAATREGSWRMGHQSFALRRPLVEDRLTPLEVYVLAECQQYAAQPRQGYLYDRGVWRGCAIGSVDVADVEDDPTRFDVRLEVLGLAAWPNWPNTSYKAFP